MTEYYINVYDLNGIYVPEQESITTLDKAVADYEDIMSHFERSSIKYVTTHTKTGVMDLEDYIEGVKEAKLRIEEDNRKYGTYEQQVSDMTGRV